MLPPPLDPHGFRSEVAAAGPRIEADRHQERDHRALRSEWCLVEGRDRIGRGERSRDLRSCHQPGLRCLRLVELGLQLCRLRLVPGAVDQVVVVVQPGLLERAA
jgi:hypothetical protein